VSVLSGLRNGGGIGDALLKPSFNSQEDVYFSRILFDLSFFGFVVVILLNGGACMLVRADVRLFF
jgi:hypothetical protein